MHRVRATLAALLLCFSAVIAAAEPIPFGRGLLFRVSVQGVPPSHVFATVHSGDDRVLDLPAPVREALEASELFAMEVLPDARAMLTSMVSMVLTDGRTLEQLIGPELFRRTVDAVAGRGLSEAGVREFKPWAMATLLSVPQTVAHDILDLRLNRLARLQGKRRVGLETIDEQLAIFDGLSERDQIRMLEDVLEVQDRLPEIFEHLLSTYLSRDLAGLVQISEQYLRAGDSVLAQQFQQRAVDDRNQRMVDRLVPLLREGNAFVAVGALHLPGDQGILEGLERIGFRVEPVY